MVRTIFLIPGSIGMGLLLHHVWHAPYPPELLVFDSDVVRQLVPFAAGFALFRLWVPRLLLSEFIQAVAWRHYVGANVTEPPWTEDFSRFGD
jgi:hypothetical protein